MPGHRVPGGTICHHRGKVKKSAHKSCPFAAMSLAYNCERVGRFLTKIARRLLHIARFEYADESYADEHREVADPVMQCCPCSSKATWSNWTTNLTMLIPADHPSTRSPALACMRVLSRYRTK